MNGSRQKADTLIDIALATYAQEILPDLPSAKRYTGAMVASALGMAQRRLGNGDPGEALVSELGGETLDGIAAEIRSGHIADQSHEQLAEKLLDYLKAELRITNPRFLKRREG